MAIVWIVIMYKCTKIKDFAYFRCDLNKFIQILIAIELSSNTSIMSNDGPSPKASSKQPADASTSSATTATPVIDEIPTLSTKRESSWPSVLFYIHLNILGLYGFTVLFTNAFFTTVIFSAVLTFIGIIGATCGAHRLWAHQSYKANQFLRLSLMMCQTMAGQVIS